MVNAADIERAVRTVPDFPRSGIPFKDITPVLADARLLGGAARLMADPYRQAGVTKVVCIEARGFVVGALVAAELNAGFVPIRKKGKLPWNVNGVSYALEYGTDTIEMHTDALTANDKVLVHDDVLATGGTAAAAEELVRRTGAQLIGFSFLIDLAYLNGRDKLASGAPVYAVVVDTG